MSTPSVQETELQNALGVVPSTSKSLACCGTTSKGPKATPAGYGSKPAIVTDFGYGPAVEMGCRAIDQGLVAIMCRTEQTTAATTGAVALTGTGTSVPSADGTNAPLDSFQVYILIIAGGTRGVAGITYQWSVDGGRTLSPTTALGTAVVITLPADTGIAIAIAAGTLVAGDVIQCTTVAPCFNTADLAAALTALQNTTSAWDTCGIANPITNTLFDQVETSFAAMSTAGKPRAYVANFRIPTDGESEAAYKTAFDTAFSARATVYGSICAGAAQITSSYSGRAYRRAVAHHVAPETARRDEQVDTADPNLGPAIGVALADANGNNVYHDESINPGLDDSRACVLRTWPDGPQGVYINTPQIMAAAGSDFSRMMFRRVMNLARRTARLFLIFRLNHPVRVNPLTGFILEEEALEIEAGGRAALQAVLGGGPKASGWSMVVHRDDNLLSTKTMHVDTRVIPLAYPETIIETIGYTNPALKTITG